MVGRRRGSWAGVQQVVATPSVNQVQHVGWRAAVGSELVALARGFRVHPSRPGSANDHRARRNARRPRIEPERDAHQLASADIRAGRGGWVQCGQNNWRRQAVSRSARVGLSDSIGTPATIQAHDEL